MPTVTSPAAVSPAAAPEEIKPLLELCRAGRLFAVQEWIAAGKPVNVLARKRSDHSPLAIAIERGFHSLVAVLLRGGATTAGAQGHAAMQRVLRLRRFDLAQLLVEHGFDAASVRMADVFDTWDPQLMEYFIDRGADIETDR